VNKKILFLTGTRADFGKLKPLINEVERSATLEAHVFVTGMHMLPKYGSTYDEVLKCGYKNIHYFINQRHNDSLDEILANTIHGLSNFVILVKPDMLIVHGDRCEALAGAIVGAMNNILVGHIEGGEISGTIDESIRHSVSKLAHIHFVANDEAKKRLIQMGEAQENIFVIGSPDIDLMLSTDLPLLAEVKAHYDIPYERYSLFAYHPVTSSLHDLNRNIVEVASALIESKRNYVAIYPNNDPGSDIILNELFQLEKSPRIKLFPSIRFEAYLVLLKNCEFIIGNSSAGVREAPFYSIPSINIGTRQQCRFRHPTIIDVKEDKDKILNSLNRISDVPHMPSDKFGDGRSADRFAELLRRDDVWKISIQKRFLDID